MMTDQRDHSLGNGYFAVTQDRPGSGVSVAGHYIRPGSQGCGRIHARYGTESPVWNLERFGTRSGVRPRLFGHDMLTPISDVPPLPTPGAQLGPDFVSQQQAD